MMRCICWDASPASASGGSRHPGRNFSFQITCGLDRLPPPSNEPTPLIPALHSPRSGIKCCERDNDGHLYVNKRENNNAVTPRTALPCSLPPSPGPQPPLSPHHHTPHPAPPPPRCALICCYFQIDLSWPFRCIYMCATCQAYTKWRTICWYDEQIRSLA